jgi:thiamine biosynthesis lipoprotein
MISVADTHAAGRRTRCRRSHPVGWLFFVAGLLLLAGCGARAPESERLQGATMGTTWSLVLVGTGQRDGLQDELEATLEAVNASMSTYRQDAEISAINRLPPGEPIAVSAAFATVLEAALAVGEGSDGAYDVTVGPLVDLWGFGAASEDEWSLPAPGEIAAVRGAVGQSLLDWKPGQRTLSKRAPVALDFSSIAKGYAVDRLAEVLEKRGYGNYLVEIGGEMRAAGESPRGDAWRVAIERPVPGQRAAALGLELVDSAIATSGDYRNFVEYQGKRYSHTIDPRTGYPVTHDLVSVTVLHESCMMADAWATALSVAGPDEALRLAEANGLAVYLLRRQGDGLIAASSSAFDALQAAAAGETTE